MQDFGTGGWTAGLQRLAQSDVTAEASFLASQDLTVKRSGITLDATSVTADANGNKILKAGTFVGPKASGGKYATIAGGGTADPNVSGYLLESVNLRFGDVVAGLLIRGSVLKARVNPDPVATAGISAACAGRIIFQ